MRPGQKPDETAVEYLRRVVNNLNYEPESILDQLPSVDAVLEYFELFSATYGTDFWQGVLECIAEGDDELPALAFIEKHKLSKGWREDVSRAVSRRDPAAV